MLYFLGNALFLKGLTVGKNGFFETFYSLFIKKTKK